LGYATNDTKPFAPFVLDNQLDIRGLGNVVDKGAASVVLNTDIRYTKRDCSPFKTMSILMLLLSKT
tara:strand:+ start:965 stop:1162 length:198 start_codon:yes stop_codon:yes gene_type:complete